MSDPVFLKWEFKNQSNEYLAGSLRALVEDLTTDDWESDRACYNRLIAAEFYSVLADRLSAL